MTASQPEDVPIEKITQDEGREWGYDMYPERRPNFKKKFQITEWLFNYLPESRTHKYRCEQNVYQVFTKSKLILIPIIMPNNLCCSNLIRVHIVGPLLKIMVSALERKGW